ncbi:hypothetical protein HPB47_000183 [Ixodes persulcatus]|uniref:Uncharacterized protein n=1 Tax=Ixodes persulcatus TaxID=34615 RepID=A0AC60PTS9_IXOPE|nr:hypothetical protein HPB47_000183 [Ixodes persulcatus]
MASASAATGGTAAANAPVIEIGGWSRDADVTRSHTRVLGVRTVRLGETRSTAAPAMRDADLSTLPGHESGFVAAADTL